MPMASSHQQKQLPSRPPRISLHFTLPYFTQWGHSLVLSGSEPSLGSWNPSRALSMSPHHHGHELFWSTTLLVRCNFRAEYSYCVVDEDRRVIRRESGKQRTLSLPENLPDGVHVEVKDLWQDASSPESFLSKSAFRDAIFRSMQPSDRDLKLPYKDVQYAVHPVSNHQEDVLVQFRINCPRIQSGQDVYLTREVEALGKWDSKNALALSAVGASCWQGECVLKRSEFPVSYRYIVKDQDRIVPEVGPPRELCFDATSKRQPAMMMISDGYLKEHPWRGAGLAVPVFSLRSDKDVGVGEFLDIKLLVDLAVASGLHLIQLLPVNDTSVNGMWWDSYPYSSLSVFALHPLYLRLQRLSSKLPKSIEEEIDDVKTKLDLNQVDYDATMKAKLTIARKVFHLERDEILQSEGFQMYFEENQEWLKPYAAFCFLRDLFGTSDHSQWGVYSRFSPAMLDKLVAPTTDHFSAIAFVYYLQYNLHIQLSEAAEYARQNKVVLKGDLPIGVDRNSVDTWVNPTLFRMNSSTGAPPDYFDKNGQNWGFPTYNWEEMAKDNYGWWRARLTQLAKYFTAYRIDHILGFFRIWELPEHAVTGLMGKFRPSIPLSQAELERQGVWDFDRLSKPYVRCHILQSKFGDRWTIAARRFFTEYQSLCYEFKEEYNTEKKIVKQLSLGSGTADDLAEDVQDLKNVLIELLQEVVLMKDPEDPKSFYPRFNLDQTASFNELDDGCKHVVQSLYHDYYFRRQEALWRSNALKTLPVLLDSSDMLACGEDLGLIPACVQPVLQELGLLGLRIQRMPSAPGIEFAVPSSYEYATVCAPSCHDSSTLRAWWEEDEGRRARFYGEVLHFGDRPPAKCDPDIVHAVLEQHMEAPSMWSIIPLQDILALKEEYAKRPAKEETINDPTNPRHYWRFRVHVALEELLGDGELLCTVKELVESSGRCTPDVSLNGSISGIRFNGDSHTINSPWIADFKSSGHVGKVLKLNGHEANGKHNQENLSHADYANGNGHVTNVAVYGDL